MTTKNLGSAVSGYLDPDGRAFEGVVYQSGKPVLDKELNLEGDLSQAAVQAALRCAAPSGWISSDFLDRSHSGDGIFTPSADLNTLALPPLQALVNGWLLPIIHTGANGSNKLNLGAGPTGAGAKRTDLVILEVWRRLLSASTTEGKSQTGRIFLNGNVKIQSSDDSSLNLVDDMLDSVVNSETTKRVQIQYRLRVIPNVDLFAYPAGIDDPTVFANSVPPDAVTPNGTVSTYLYVNQSGSGDAGLWRAGDGIPSNSLGTVDGYMYAIPLCAVLRRNTTAFARNTNHNGGAASPGVSGRPDGLFHNLVAAKDLVDLRRGTSVTGWNYAEVLDKNLNALFDDALRTEWSQFSIGGGQNGHTVLMADEIGISNANGGDGTTTGDTPGANFIGEFDYTRRRFSDRVTYEVMTVKVQPGTAAVSTSTWQTGTVITLQPTALTPYPYTAFNLSTYAPSGTLIVDVVRSRILGSAAGEASVAVGAPLGNSTTFWPWSKIEGLGEDPMGPVTLTLGTIPSLTDALTTEPIYIDLLIAYPGGQGLSYTPTQDFGNDSVSINNPGALSASAPVNFASLATTPRFDYPHREICLEYLTTPLSFTFQADDDSETTYWLPERANSVSSITVNGSGASGSVTNGGRSITLTSPTSQGDEIVVNYVGRRPLPQSGVQFTIYYEARAKQTIRASLLGTSMTLIPRYTSPHLYTMTVGSGSPNEAYPFPSGYVQTGGVYPGPSGSFSGDHELNGSTEIMVANFGAATGFLKLPVTVPYVPDPQQVTFQRLSGDVDAEGRSFFKSVPSSAYMPNAFAQPLSDARVHKVILPTLMEAAADTSFGRKGTLFLVLLTRWATEDGHNSVVFTDSVLTSGNTTTASIYRLNGNLLNKRV